MTKRGKTWCLSNEDLALKQQLESYVERAQDPDPGLQKVALESMRDGAKLKVGEGLVAAKLMDNRTGVVRRCKAMEMVRIGNLKF
ncbi:uncharacterized protein LOC108997120 isoform X3 [Juglans regia]|uniref:Uncharacterized protein LOC108997120 isoform X3 n=1 Tax=Juglans regia TaxID=51240 RepID=A0A2I4FAY7_JUGRE|nr:uncharacterized protein LOC108997120 isoform X3 [Juglans regia]